LSIEERITVKYSADYVTGLLSLNSGARQARTSRTSTLKLLKTAPTESSTVRASLCLVLPNLFAFTLAFTVPVDTNEHFMAHTYYARPTRRISSLDAKR
jgi:hypothetical protein